MSSESQTDSTAKSRGDALENAIARGDVRAVRTLLKGGVDINACHALNAAASEDSLTIVKLLIEHGADVNLQDGRGYTPLHYASEVGQEQTCRLLLQAGASVNAVASDGNTPLHFAVEHAESKLARFLIRQGAHVDSANHLGITALHLAVNNQSGDYDMALVKQLLELGVSSSFVPDPIPQDEEYLTPFQSALISWNEEAAWVMFDFARENPHQTTLDGRTMDALVGAGADMKAFLHMLRTEWAVMESVDLGADSTPAGPRRSPGMSML